MQGYCDGFFLRIILKRTSTEAHVYMRPHQGAKVKHLDISNVIYHKFSHGAVSYTLNGENVNVMLEYSLFTIGFLKIETDKSEQTVQTQIILLLRDCLIWDCSVCHSNSGSFGCITGL